MRLLYFTSPGKQKQYLLMDRAYSSKKRRIAATELVYAPVVPPKRNYKEQWEYDEELYKGAMRLSDFLSIKTLSPYFYSFLG